MVLKKIIVVGPKSLVLGEASLSLQKGRSSPLVTVSEVGKQLLLLAEQAPGRMHPSLQLLHVPGRLQLGLDDSLPLPPENSMGFWSGD